MIFCGFDLETSGLGEGCKILAVACALYDTESKQVVRSFQTQVWHPDYPPPFQEALDINGLRVDVLKRYGMHPQHAFHKVESFFCDCRAIVAHNGLSFDKPVYEAEFKTYRPTETIYFNSDYETGRGANRPWIDTKIDIDYPAHMKSRSLNHLAVDHGIWNPGAHNALFDVFTMLNILSKYDAQSIFERAQSPIVRVEANPPREKNEILKKRYFRWDPTRKVWWKNIRKITFEAEKKDLDFELTIV